MEKEKIVKEVMKEIKRIWSGETQVGFSELAMQDAIKLAIEKKDKEIKKLEEECGKLMNDLNKIESKTRKSQTKRFLEMIEKLDEWINHNNTIPMKDLHNIECICGHSLLEHRDFSLDKMEGNECSHKFCDCPSYDKIKLPSQMRLATTDGGWVNGIKLHNKLKELLTSFGIQEEEE